MSSPMAVASEQSQKIFRVGFGVADLVSAVLVYVGVFEGLPSRYGPVDAAARSVAASMLATLMLFFPSNRRPLGAVSLDRSFFCLAT